MFDRFLFVFHNPAEQDDAGSPKVVRQVSFRIVRPFDQLFLDHSRPLSEVMDESIITLCVEPGEDRSMTTFHACSLCGAPICGNTCPFCFPTVYDRHPPVVSPALPKKVERFIISLGHAFAVDPDIARDRERSEWVRGELIRNLG